MSQTQPPRTDDRMEYILPNLLIANCMGAINTSMIAERGVTHVLSLSGMAFPKKKHGSQKAGVTYTLCHLDDCKEADYRDVLSTRCSVVSFTPVGVEAAERASPSAPSPSPSPRKEDASDSEEKGTSSPKLPTMKEFIEEGIKPGNTLVVNCFKAWTRSPFICMTILIKYFDYSLLESLVMLSCTGVARINPWASMISCLADTAKEMGKMGEEELPEGFFIDCRGDEGSKLVAPEYLEGGDRREWMLEKLTGIEGYKRRMEFLGELEKRKEEGKGREEKEEQNVAKKDSDGGKGGKKRKAGESGPEKDEKADSSALKKTKHHED